MSTPQTAKILEALAEECKEDYVGLWEVVKQVRRAFPDAEAGEIQAISLDLVRDLLRSGQAVAGDLSNEGQFLDWRLDVDRAVERIGEEWDRLGRDPNISEVVWLTAPLP